MKVSTKAVLPLAFKANAVSCGLKRSGKSDLALIYSTLPAKVHALFTSNTIKAAPISVNKNHLKRNKVFRAIIVNSGNANCFTGKSGILDAEKTAAVLAKHLKIKNTSVLVNSTGIIGKRLAVGKIIKAIASLTKGLSSQGLSKSAKAIMTTDTFAKMASVKFAIGEKTVTISGIAKGAGMIAPNMATLLAFIVTDANIAQNALSLALRTAVDKSFNCITVDGCMSTNDTAAILANGASSNSLIKSGRAFKLFEQGLNAVCLQLAKMVVKDAEGATKFIEITVDQAKTARDAKTVALAIANSDLFKTAVYGENPNFGRISAAAGASGVKVSEKDLKVRVSSLKKKNVSVHVSLGKGKSKAVVYTSDLTPEYIKINAEYN
jgi:glutamate N-acetyltransferase/amino-acid N-acetyltransferase